MDATEVQWSSLLLTLKVLILKKKVTTLTLPEMELAITKPLRELPRTRVTKE